MQDVSNEQEVQQPCLLHVEVSEGAACRRRGNCCAWQVVTEHVWSPSQVCAISLTASPTPL